MRRSQADILVTAAVALLTTAAALLGAPTAVMTVLGIALLASPGYVWGSVLVGSLVTGLERVAVSAALSLAVPVLGGLALRAAGVLLTRFSWIGLLAGVTLAGDAVLAARRRAKKSPPFGWRREMKVGLPRRHLAAFSAAVLIAAAGMALAGVSASRQHYQGFTQLWLVTRHGTPRAASIGVSNHQHSTTRYRLQILRKGHATITRTLTLTDGQTWHSVVQFAGSPTIAANLYLPSDPSHPYRHVLTDASAVP